MRSEAAVPKDHDKEAAKGTRSPEQEALKGVQERLGVFFREEALLATALTHSSYTMEQEMSRALCNERLEFLGDAFFDAIVGEALYLQLPEEEEGVLTKKRALVVCEESLYECALELRIGSALQLGKGEANSGGRQRRSILADAMEALIGALYLDQGYEAAQRTVLRLFEERIVQAIKGNIVSDYKSTLQEALQQEGPVSIEYRLVGAEGPDHDKRFFIQVMVDGTVLGEGSGKNKKEAEQKAAREALATTTTIR